jgi:hypothetical protein
MAESLDREGERRYAIAFYHAVVIERLRFPEAEPFASWYARAGFLFHQTVEAAFDNWVAFEFPRIVEDRDDE